MGFLSDTWPFFGAMALVGVIIWGALQPYIRQDRKRRQAQENQDD
ncbi:hypothetical protein GGQ68_001384 [Sagittula marina]|uniref:Uncharacterized protein n=1 Tax=Sagittula marina TaxID=943940 RepID=A0A7W6GRM2_9RHOB|nr:hypothetical protein [Sagittula marina]